MALSLKQKFLQLESAGGMLLFLAALIGFIAANSPLAGFYQAVFNPRMLFFINDGLMTLFFLLVGLELKRECIHGELASFSQMLLPLAAALGGMIVPAIIYVIENYHDPILLRGWAVPVATDIAFALGVLSLFGKRVPVGLKLFLTALAIFDDVGAILIVAIFYTQTITLFYLIASVLVLVTLIIVNFMNVTRLSIYLLLGTLLWIFIYKSGIHATIAGVLFAFMLPLSPVQTRKQSLLHRLECNLHPFVAYGVMPFFAFANAGVSLVGIKPTFLLNSVSLGIILGLFLGKQGGVFGAAWLTIKAGWAELPAQVTWLSFYGVALLCGIGFTMSLFLGSLAFEVLQPDCLVQVRLGVIIGSLMSALVAIIVLLVVYNSTIVDEKR